MKRCDQQLHNCMITSFRKYAQKRDLQEASSTRYARIGSADPNGFQELEPRILPDSKALGVMAAPRQQYMMPHQATMPTDTHGQQQITMPAATASQSSHVLSPFGTHTVPGQDSAGPSSHLFGLSTPSHGGAVGDHLHGLGIDDKTLAAMIQGNRQAAPAVSHDPGAAHHDPAAVAASVAHAAASTQHAIAGTAHAADTAHGDTDGGDVAEKLQEEMRKAMEGREVEVHEDEHGDLHVELPDTGEDAQEMHERMEKAKEKVSEVLERLGKFAEKIQDLNDNSFKVSIQPFDDGGDMFTTLSKAEARDYLALAGIRPEKRRKKKRRR